MFTVTQKQTQFSIIGIIHSQFPYITDRIYIDYNLFILIGRSKFSEENHQTRNLGFIWQYISPSSLVIYLISLGPFDKTSPGKPNVRTHKFVLPRWVTSRALVVSLCLLHVSRDPTLNLYSWVSMVTQTENRPMFVYLKPIILTFTHVIIGRTVRLSQHF